MNDSMVAPMPEHGRFFHDLLRDDFAALAQHLELGLLRDSHWLICGATGLVPAYLADFLAWVRLEAGIPVKLSLWVRSTEKAAHRFSWLKACSAEVVAPDWHNPYDWGFPEAQFVLHAASPATPAACAADPYGLLTCNGLVSQRLVETVPVSPLRAVLYLSSSEVYGNGVPAAPEEGSHGQIDPAAPRSLYPLAKRLGESLFQEAARTRGLPVRIARLFHTYGPGMDLEHDTRAFAAFVAMVLRGEPIRMSGDGRPRRAYCYLADTACALMTLMLHPEAPMVANVGNPAGILSVSELAHLLHRLAGRSDGMVGPTGGEVQSQSGDVFPNVARLEALGWKARTCPEEGFARTLHFHSR